MLHLPIVSIHCRNGGNGRPSEFFPDREVQTCSWRVAMEVYFLKVDLVSLKLAFYP